jgi:Zn finger protein HypA/HybF involved in hydrogenase expression
MVTSLYRTLEQELHALARGISLECLVCGEFVLRSGWTISCPECGSHLRGVAAEGEADRQVGLPAG